MGALLAETARKLESPVGALRIKEQSWRHASPARCYPMNQGYRSGGVVGHVARFQGSHLGAQNFS